MTQLEAPVAPSDADPLPTHVRIAAVGAGFSGLALGMRLQEEGIDDFVILERSSDVGGTWRENTYPGCACDVPSHLYSFSFAPNPDWSRTYSEQPEIYDYIRRTASERGVLAYVRFGHDVQSSRWNEEEQRWEIETSAGAFTASYLVSAMGPLSAPAWPKLRGQDLPLGRVGPRPRPRRRARRGDRHGRLGDPVRARDPAARGHAPRLSAHPAVGHAAPRPRHDSPRAPRLPSLPAAPEAGPDHGLLALVS